MHFTYQPPEGDLQQGDLLEITEELRSVLLEYHPHYGRHKGYKRLIVLTQSCDLQRRDGVCKSRYITVAAVRPFETAIQREIEKFLHSSIEKKLRICNQKYREKVREVLEKFLNNNLPDYFYLEPDNSIGSIEPMAAFLTLSIALKATEHYEKCMAARVGQLKSVFQAKLGWLVGNSFSRVGTPDWVPMQLTDEEFEGKVNDWLKENLIWVDSKALRELSKKQKSLRSSNQQPDYVLSLEEAMNTLNDYAAKLVADRQILTQRIIRHVTEVFPDASQHQIDKLTKRLNNAQEINAFLRV